MVALIKQNGGVGVRVSSTGIGGGAEGGVIPANMDIMSAPATTSRAITAHATNAISPVPRALYVGSAGDITMRLSGDAADVLWPSVPAGAILPVEVQYIRVAGTAASGFVALGNADGSS